MTYKREILTKESQEWIEKEMDETFNDALKRAVDQMNRELKRRKQEELDEMETIFFKQFMLMKLKTALNSNYLDVKMYNITLEGLEQCGFTEEAINELE